MGVFYVFYIEQIVSNRAKQHIYAIYHPSHVSQVKCHLDAKIALVEILLQ